MKKGFAASIGAILLALLLLVSPIAGLAEETAAACEVCGALTLDGCTCPPVEKEATPAAEIVDPPAPEPPVEETPAPTPVPTVQPTEAPTPVPTERAVFKVSYDFNGVKMLMEVREGDLVEPLEVKPYLEGYVFLHWYDVLTESEIPFEFGIPAARDIELKPFFVLPTDERLIVEETPTQEPPADTTWIEDEPAYVEPTPVPEIPTQLDNGATVVGAVEGLSNGLVLLVVENPGAETADVSGDPAPDAETGEAGETTLDVPVPAVVLRTVSVIIDAPKDLQYGDTVTLRGVLTGYDSMLIALQWEYDAGAGWTEVPGATGLHHSFVLAEDNAGFQWRLTVTLLSDEPI